MLAAVLAGLSVGVVSGCGPGVLTLGVSYDRPGLAIRAGNDFSGFDTVLGRDLARRLGHPGKKDVSLINVPERRTTPPTGELPYDVLVAAYPATDALRAKADLVGPYLSGVQDLAVRADERDAVSATSLAGRRVCAVAGSEIGRTAPTAFPGATIAYRSTLSTCLTELRRGTVDAVTDERLALRGYAAEQPFRGTIRVAGVSIATFDYYLAVRRKDPRLCGRVKDALTAAVADGGWARAYEEQLVRTGVTERVPAPPRAITGCTG
ncbi:hypothetical protein ADJ73_14175 [Arsenicicoccus sp. oral taxon 190]|nr:hypothetical protein ADJ73_14175 [Arsenicicoccus sp. oral taxon 190]